MAFKFWQWDDVKHYELKMIIVFWRLTADQKYVFKNIAIRNKSVTLK